MVLAPVVPSSDYTETTTVFQLYILAEEFSPKTKHLHSEIIAFYVFFTYYFLYAKTKQDKKPEWSLYLYCLLPITQRPQRFFYCKY